MQNKKNTTAKQALILGAFWSITTRWSIKGLGFVNTVIMARILLPSDYGIVAMAMLIVGLTQALIDFGANTAILRKKELTREEIDSAWTLKLLQGLLICIILIISAPLASTYFNEPRVLYVIWILALCLGISGTSNIGLILAQKEFNFKIDFKLNLICKTLGVASTISSGYYFRDYRALVIGIATAYILTVVLSYTLHPYRPRFTIKKIGEIWATTKWLMLSGIAGFFLRKTDELVAAKIGTTSDYGIYNIGSDFGQLPTAEIGPAMLKAFLPVLASLKEDISEINSAVTKTIGALNTITYPIGFGFAAIATPATYIILGNNWINAANFVAMFSIASTIQISPSPYNTLLIMRGHAKIHNSVIWVEFFIFLFASIILVPFLHLTGLVLARIIGSLTNFCATAILTNKYCKTPLKRDLATISRPIAGSILMYFIVLYSINKISNEEIQILTGITIGATFYITWIYSTWKIAGKPDGIEKNIICFLKNKVSTKS